MSMEATGINDRRTFNTQPDVSKIPCSWCGQKLIKIPFGTRYALVCDNHKCHLFRERQVSEVKVKATKDEASNLHRKTLRGYRNYLKKKRDNYRKLRDAGVDCRTAAKCQSDKRVRELLESFGGES